MKWYRRVASADKTTNDDLIAAVEASEAYLKEYLEAREELAYSGPIERIESKIAGMHDYRYAQLQELEIILEYLEQRELRAKVDKTREYMDHYQRTLTETVARNYADASSEVQDIREVIRQVAHVRNMFIGNLKGIEYMHFQLGNITKLKSVGMEDAIVDLRRDN